MADNNFRSYADVDHLSIVDEIIKSDNPLCFSDTLKLSNVASAEIFGCYIVGGKEDCIDIMRKSSLVNIVHCTLASSGKFCITIKGGSGRIKISNLVIENHGTETDIDIGNYYNSFEPGWLPVEDVVINNVTSSDGKPVKVRLLNCNKVTIIGGNCKVTKVPSIFWKIYFTLRDWNIIKG